MNCYFSIVTHPFCDVKIPYITDKTAKESDIQRVLAKLSLDKFSEHEKALTRITPHPITLITMLSQSANDGS